MGMSSKVWTLSLCIWLLISAVIVILKFWLRNLTAFKSLGDKLLSLLWVLIYWKPLTLALYVIFWLTNTLEFIEEFHSEVALGDGLPQPFVRTLHCQVLTFYSSGLQTFLIMHPISKGVLSVYLQYMLIFKLYAYAILLICLHTIKHKQKKKGWDKDKKHNFKIFYLSMTKIIFFLHPKGLCCVPPGVCAPHCGDHWSKGLRLLQPLRATYASATPLSFWRCLFFPYGQTEFPAVQYVSVTSCTFAACPQENFDLRFSTSILQVVGSSQ